MINKEVFKEPRGFIKLLEIILAICAFATAVGPHLTTSSVCKCNEKEEAPNECTFKYPYVMNEEQFFLPHCENSTNETTTTQPPMTMSLSGDCKSASEFYVFVGVVVFLYSLGAIVFYVIAHELYEGHQIFPKADFILTILFTLLWLISSSAFADAVSKIKHYTDPEWPWESDESSLYTYYTDHEKFGLNCYATESASYATLNISVIFGFLNMIVWAGNNWFLYKETNWFESDSSPPPMPPTSSSHVEPKV